MLFRSFASLPKISAVNLDDPFGENLAAQLAVAGSTRVVTYGENPHAQVRAENVTLTLGHTACRLIWPGGALEIVSPLVGRGHVNNLLGAVAAAWALGHDPAVFLARLSVFPGVPGRMERIDDDQPFDVIVDSARSEGALRHALATLRQITPGRLFVVFGAGADGERAARPRLTRAVQEHAGFAVGTADNPRHEPIARIFDDLRGGVIAPEKITWIGDRRYAIAVALSLARPGDCVLIAGKGHECCQKIAGTIFPFDDRQVVRECLAENLLRVSA